MGFNKHACFVIKGEVVSLSLAAFGRLDHAGPACLWESAVTGMLKWLTGKTLDAMHFSIRSVISWSLGGLTRVMYALKLAKYHSGLEITSGLETDLGCWQKTVHLGYIWMLIKVVFFFLECFKFQLSASLLICTYSVCGFTDCWVWGIFKCRAKPPVTLHQEFVYSALV